MASSTPGIAKARSCIMDPIIPFESAYWEIMIKITIKQSCGGEEGTLTLFDHLLNRAGWVDLHCKQVAKPVHLGGILRKLLTKCVGQVMSWIRGLTKG